MAQILYTNNATANTVGLLNPGDTALTLTSGAPFPTPTGGDFFFLTLDDGSNIEIVKVTARSGDVLTIERAQQGTVAGNFASGTPVALRVTAGGFEHIYTQINLKLDASAVSTFGGTLIDDADASAARTTLGLGNLAAFTASAFALTILDDADASAVRTTIGAAATSHTHAASDITSGTIATARLGSGTANSTTFLRGDQTWATAGGGDMLKSENLSGLANYTTARSNLGLGTAAVLNTGTSGATIPRNDTANTFSDTQTATRYQVGTFFMDDNIGLGADIPGFNFDANDWFVYKRAINRFEFAIGGTEKLILTESDALFSGIIGVNIAPAAPVAVRAQTSDTSAIATASGGLSTAEFIGNGGAAKIALRRPGAFAGYLGLDTDNKLKWGGWSLGANAYPVILGGYDQNNTNLILGTSTTQTDARIRLRKNGNNIEWGHTNTGGYHATLGAEVGTGNPFWALSAEAGSTNNTYRTRGRYGHGARISGGDGELQFFSLAGSNADNQSPTTTMAIKRTGEVVLTDVGPTSTLAAGYRGAPRNRQDGNYTLVLSDAGKLIMCFGSGTFTHTIPANSSVAYPIGTTIVFCAGSAATVNIAITTDQMNLAPGGSTGTRTLAPYGIATAIKIDITNWVISGAGLT